LVEVFRLKKTILTQIMNQMVPINQEPVSQDFDAYKVFYITSMTKPFKAVISCYLNEVEVGIIRFVADGQKITKPHVEGGKVTLDFPLSRFNDIHNILLHEKPLFLYINAFNEWGSVTTGALEPTGEMEPTAFLHKFTLAMKEGKLPDRVSEQTPDSPSDPAPTKAPGQAAGQMPDPKTAG